MDSLKDFFERMDAVDFQYVVLRNWENLPNDVCLGEHSDLDILCYDYEHFMEIFPMAKAEYGLPRVRVKVPIGESFFYCDVRHVGDGYYPVEFSRAILSNKEFNQKGFWTPDSTHHMLALAYHVVHHKNKLSYNYIRHLGEVTVEELTEAIKESSVGWVQPNDPTVGAFNAYWKGATSIVERRDGFVFKKQFGYTDYPLIQREFDILSKANSQHFPKVYSLTDGVLQIEDCGVSLLQDIPSNWEEQLRQIALGLSSQNIQHRDIRLDNLMVKDGIIKLIDFGWAKYKDEVEEVLPPSCLGYPNKPSSGWDDNFSIRSVSKQIQYHLEEK